MQPVRSESNRDDPGSPCSGDCEFDERLGLCRGCLRTMDEIVRWAGLDADERRRVLRQLANRSLKPDSRAP